MHRRKVIGLIATLPLCAMSFDMRAQQRNDITQIIVPFAPGGSGDILARLLAQHMSEKYGQPTVVDLKPGANGIIGMQMARSAPGNGRTLVVASTSTFSANPTLFKKLPYDPDKDFSLVGVLGAGGSYMLVRPNAPYKSLAEFVAQAKAAPGSINYGYFNASSQVPGALLAARAGIDVVPVPYKQIGTALTDLMSGQVQVLFVDTAAADSYVTSGQLRPLAVTHGTRLTRHPDIPTLAETWMGLEIIGFIGIAVPSSVPDEMKISINKMVNEAVQSNLMREKLETFGFLPYALNLQDTQTFAKTQRAKWQEYITVAKIPAQ